MMEKNPIVLPILVIIGVGSLFLVAALSIKHVAAVVLEKR